MRVGSLGREDLLEHEMATHASILAWKIPWTEEPCELQSMRPQRAEHKRNTKRPQRNTSKHTPLLLPTPCVGLDEADPILGCPDQLA